MTPYSGLLFFGILTAVLLPAVILGLLGKSLRIYGLIATVLLLLTAFDTTIVGLLSAAVAMLISTTRKRWYSNYMSILEALTECVLEVEKNHAETE